jgi:ComF family protein
MSLIHDRNQRSWKPGPAARALTRGLLDLVFPPHTLDRTGRAQSTGLSAEAWTRVSFIGEPVCDGCGAPFEYELGERCAACLARPRAFDRARAAVLYDEASRDLILQFKHADRTDLAGLFVGWIGRAAEDLLRDADVIAPVPLHRSRLLARRFNQAAEIARPLARRHRIAYLPDVLMRGAQTESQAGQSGAARRRNVAGAFSTRTSPRRRIEGRRVLLIDDVMTTGATAEACARVLRAAGASAVDVAVIARVRDAASVSI